jgi:GntR family transcriptional regulator
MQHVQLKDGKSIDRNTPLPYYFQVKELLVEEVESGRWQPDQQIPSESELCEHFGVSRTVVRQALNNLVQDGFLYRHKGRGTFVAKPKIMESLAQNLSGFYEDMVARGLQPVTKVLEQTRVEASRKVADHLGLSLGDPVIKIDRLRFVNDEPLLLVVTYLPYEICPSLLEEDMNVQSLYALLEDKYGLKIVRGWRTLEAVAANEYEAHLLKVKVCAPLMLLNSVSYLADGRPIEYFHALHRGDRSKFEVALVRVRNHTALSTKANNFAYLPSGTGLFTQPRVRL